MPGWREQEILSIRATEYARMAERLTRTLGERVSSRIPRFESWSGRFLCFGTIIFIKCAFSLILMGWKTYLVMYFGTSGDFNMSEIVGKVEELGFNSELGPIDHVYDWEDKKPEKEDIFELGNKLMETLKGSGVIFNLDTHD